MSGLTSFYKQNAIKVENIKCVASDRFLDEKNKPLQWELKALTTKEDENLRKKCEKKVAHPTKKGVYTQETDTNLYIGRLAVECTVFPNLKDANLQDSYGVMGADDLIKAMLTPGEYIDYIGKIQEINGYDRNINELADEIKN